MNKLLPLCLLAVFTTVPLKAQLPPTTAQETPRKEWFGDIFIGYSFRMGRPTPPSSIGSAHAPASSSVRISTA